MYPLSDSFDSSGLDRQPFNQPQYPVSLELLNPELVSFLAERDVYVSWAVIFLTYAINIPHSDSATPLDYVRLNWQFSEGKDATMRWYHPKPGIDSMNLTNPVGRKHYLYYHHDLDLVHEEQIGFPSIVQVTIPHDVDIPTKPRYCLSMLLHRTSTNELIHMADAQEIFKDCVREERTESQPLRIGASEGI